jgi:hypothetical protein
VQNILLHLNKKKQRIRKKEERNRKTNKEDGRKEE